MKSYPEKITLIKDDVFTNLPPVPLSRFQKAVIQDELREDIKKPQFMINWRRIMGFLSLGLTCLVMILVATKIILNNDSWKALPETDLSEESTHIRSYLTLATLFYDSKRIFNDQKSILLDENAQYISHYVSIFPYFFADVSSSFNLDSNDYYEYSSPSSSQENHLFNFSFKEDSSMLGNNNFFIQIKYLTDELLIHGEKLEIDGVKSTKLQVNFDEQNFVVLENKETERNNFYYKIIKNGAIYSEAKVIFNKETAVLSLEGKVNETLITYLIIKNDNKYLIDCFNFSYNDLNLLEHNRLEDNKEKYIVISQEDELINYQVYINDEIIYNQSVPLE